MASSVRCAGRVMVPHVPVFASCATISGKVHTAMIVRISMVLIMFMDRQESLRRNRGGSIHIAAIYCAESHHICAQYICLHKTVIGGVIVRYNI